MTNLKRADKTAGNRRRKHGLIIVSCLLSSLGAVCMLVPYASMYFILKELLEHSASPVLAGGAEMIRWGVIALLSFAAGLIMMYAYDSLERMNASAVQYVRGMPAVKVFGQTVQSFRQFHQDMIRKAPMMREEVIGLIKMWKVDFLRGCASER